MARAQGARAQMALAFETTYGTPPASGYTRMPFASATLGAEQPLLNSELLGYGRDPLPPIKDAVTSDGDVVVPIDAQAFGFWLKAAFGNPTTTGAEAPYTHQFQSGAWALPSMSIETGMPEVPRYAMYSGCVLDQLSWQMQRSGLLTATARLVAQGEAVGATTNAGTPAELALKRFGHFNGRSSATARRSAMSSRPRSPMPTISDRIETIRADGRIDGADPSIAAPTRRSRPCPRAPRMRPAPWPLQKHSRAGRPSRGKAWAMPTAHPSIRAPRPSTRCSTSGRSSRRSS